MQSRIQERIMGLPVLQIMVASKVFTVEMPHQHVHQAYPGDYVVFNIKGLDTLEQIVGEPVPPVMEGAVEVCVLIRTPEQLVDEVVRQIAEEIVEGPVPLERIPVPSQRELHEALRRFYEQYTFEEDEEEEEEEDEEEEEEISRFPPYFRPRRWRRFVDEGACCPYGSRCTFAHHESEFLGAPADSTGAVFGHIVSARQRWEARADSTGAVLGPVVYALCCWEARRDSTGAVLGQGVHARRRGGPDLQETV